jgi:small multidrug resistance pump
MHYLWLAIAIVGEVIATSALKASDQFRRPAPTVLVITGYLCAFYFMSMTLKSIPVGVVYAIWSGLGVVLVAIAAALLYREVPDRPAILGMALIIVGVVVINVFSKTVSH